jgi:hypothetical protein
LSLEYINSIDVRRKTKEAQKLSADMQQLARESAYEECPKNIILLFDTFVKF